MVAWKGMLASLLLFESHKARYLCFQSIFLITQAFTKIHSVLYLHLFRFVQHYTHLLFLATLYIKADVVRRSEEMRPYILQHFNNSLLTTPRVSIWCKVEGFSSFVIYLCLFFLIFLHLDLIYSIKKYKCILNQNQHLVLF